MTPVPVLRAGSVPPDQHLGKSLRQDLQRHVATQLCVYRAVHLVDSARPKFFENLAKAEISTK
jgi:hypothetical protein